MKPYGYSTKDSLWYFFDEPTGRRRKAKTSAHKSVQKRARKSARRMGKLETQ